MSKMDELRGKLNVVDTLKVVDLDQYFDGLAQVADEYNKLTDEGHGRDLDLEERIRVRLYGVRK